MKDIFVLCAKEEGPNTFWSPTVWEDIDLARRCFPDAVYKEIDGKIYSLAANIEGPNTFWGIYAEGTCPDDMTAKEFFKIHSPADPTRLYVTEIPKSQIGEA